MTAAPPYAPLRARPSPEESLMVPTRGLEHLSRDLKDRCFPLNYAGSDWSGLSGTIRRHQLGRLRHSLCTKPAWRRPWMHGSSPCMTKLEAQQLFLCAALKTRAYPVGGCDQNWSRRREFNPRARFCRPAYGGSRHADKWFSDKDSGLQRTASRL
jgi:hypothetical protein